MCEKAPVSALFMGVLESHHLWSNAQTTGGGRYFKL